MCGRFAQIQEEEKLMQSFSVHTSEITPTPNYNIAPGSELVVILEEEGLHKMVGRQWGLIPFWAQDGGRGMINARSETVQKKPSFRQGFAKRRCLIPASGYYEWKHGPEGKQPWYFSGSNLQTLAFAGIWDQWRSVEGNIKQTCAILTCAANELITPIHQRMPVILIMNEIGSWLGNRSSEQLQELLQPYPSDWMQAWPVSPMVNRPSFNGPKCFEPLNVV